VLIEVTSLAELDLLRMIDPRDAEYPCVCGRCGAQLSVYRPEDTPRILVQDAAAMIHRDESPHCSALEMTVLDPLPFGPQPQEAA
jgi:hypothetical protein